MMWISVDSCGFMHALVNAECRDGLLQAGPVAQLHGGLPGRKHARGHQEPAGADERAAGTANAAQHGPHEEKGNYAQRL